MKMPVLFIGHGSPMNAIDRNTFTERLAALGLPTPKAILVISAHWVTDGTKVLSAERPKTIHDFHGFPKALYEIQYPAPGAPELAQKIIEAIPGVQADASWGLDHGTWSILRHMFPKADVPVLQLSLDQGIDLDAHVQMGRNPRFLRDQGVLIVGSGNIVHNLRELDFGNDPPAMDWAENFDALIKTALETRDMPQILAEDSSKHPLWKRAQPSLEHYVPLLYALGAAEDNEKPLFVFEGIQNGSISMRSIRYG
jgi:4,5-DOPA dioxygenase extradiol